jgi:hypothetical protein
MIEAGVGRRMEEDEATVKSNAKIPSEVKVNSILCLDEKRDDANDEIYSLTLLNVHYPNALARDTNPKRHTYKGPSVIIL